MKFKLLLLFAVIAIVNISTFAEHDYKPGVFLGFDGYTETKAGNLMAHGIVAGAIIDLLVSNNFGIDVGIAFLQRGTGFGYPNDTLFSKRNYLAFPLHIKLKKPTRLFTPYGLFGLDLGVLLSAKYNTFDLGYDFGIGIDVNLKRVTPFFEAIGNVGITNLDLDQPGSDKNTDWGYEIKAGVKYNY
jgi:hypothetical protein